MRRFAPAIVAALALSSVVGTSAGAAAFGRADARQAPRFLASVVRLLAANRYAEAWTTLDPVDQALVPRANYVACESAHPVPGRLLSIRTLSVGRERVAITTAGPVVASIAVRFAVVIAGPGAPVRVPVLAHAIDVAGRWRWMLPAARLPAYRACTPTR